MTMDEAEFWTEFLRGPEFSNYVLAAQAAIHDKPHASDILGKKTEFAARACPRPAPRSRAVVVDGRLRGQDGD
jgi:hypothetical protein